MIAWVDASVGAAGDMLLAALLDAGAERDRVEEGLRALDVGPWELRTQEVTRGAFRALHLRFEVPPEDHPHRPWSEVRRILASAALPERARERALATYRRLAEAEARLHGVPVEDVELHEVGAVDAILDVTGVCLALEEVEVLVATPLPMGTGQAAGAHGRIPLPAPATLALCRGWPLVPAPAGEWVTPTAAALITTLATPAAFPAMVPERIGHGAGTRDPEGVANLVRVVLGRGEGGADQVVELACNLDDLPGELVPPLVERLLDEGALDAWAVPIHMKKGRPGLLLQALARPGDADRLSDLLLRHSSTLGVRRRPWDRKVLDRWVQTVPTAYGPIRIKVGGRAGEAWHAAPEFEDVAERARAAGVPLQEVYAAALAAWRSLD